MPEPRGEHVPCLPDGLLLESVVSTLNADGSPHLAPMGPIVDAGFSRLLLRPYQTSVTYQNLKRTRQGVMHVTDDVALFARAAVGQLKELPELVPATAIKGVVLKDTCRWYAFRVVSIDDRQERTEIVAETVDHGRVRDFFGFNRAKHAVIEAAILATRIKFIAASEVEAEFERLAVPIAKTGGHQEHRTFAFLQRYVHEQIANLRTESIPQ